MFAKFESAFATDDAAFKTGSLSASSSSGSLDLPQFFDRYAGATFNRGVYRVLAPSTVQLGNRFVENAFPQFSGKAACFASDWLGRLFCLDASRREGGSAAVLMLEPGTGQSLEIPANLQSFHEEELVHYADAALATGFYRQWLASGGQVPRIDQCIGYKKPLFLGGVDTVENLELSDLDVYWTISGQLIRKARGLPIGTKIGKISLS